MISAAYERTSVIVTTNLPFERWVEVLGSERLTGAVLDRLTHRCHILEMNGESYRLKDAKRRRSSRASQLTPPAEPPADSQAGPGAEPIRGMTHRVLHSWTAPRYTFQPSFTKPFWSTRTCSRAPLYTRVRTVPGAGRRLSAGGRGGGRRRGGPGRRRVGAGGPGRGGAQVGVVGQFGGALAGALGEVALGEALQAPGEALSSQPLFLVLGCSPKASA